MEALRKSPKRVAWVVPASGSSVTCPVGWDPVFAGGHGGGSSRLKWERLPPCPGLQGGGPRGRKTGERSGGVSGKGSLAPLGPRPRRHPPAFTPLRSPGSPDGRTRGSGGGVAGETAPGFSHLRRRRVRARPVFRRVLPACTPVRGRGCRRAGRAYCVRQGAGPGKHLDAGWTRGPYNRSSTQHCETLVPNQETHSRREPTRSPPWHGCRSRGRSYYPRRRMAPVGRTCGLWHAGRGTRRGDRRRDADRVAADQRARGSRWGACRTFRRAGTTGC